jgi:phosphoglycolate phosphatase
MHNDAVIFDIDGTLWDASQTSTEGWNSGLAKLGIENKIKANQLISVTGNPYEQCVDILLPGLKLKYPNLLQTLNDCEILAIKSRGGEFFNGVIEGIRGLSTDFKIFLVSNCQEWYMDLFLDFSGLRQIFEGFDCHGSSGLTKGMMLRRMKIDYRLNSPVYVGDTGHDQVASRQAGMEFIHVSWGFGGFEGDTKIVNSFMELVEYLREKSH